MDECSKVDASCQTLSTGDIVITKIFFNEDQVPDKEIRLSPNRIINNSPCWFCTRPHWRRGILDRDKYVYSRN